MIFIGLSDISESEDETKSEETSFDDSVSSDAQDNSLSDATIDERHYNSLNKEQKKKKPNKSVINKYLNMEFVSRRNRLQATVKESRPQFIIENYPCFKDPSEVCKMQAILIILKIGS